MKTEYHFSQRVSIYAASQWISPRSAVRSIINRMRSELVKNVWELKSVEVSDGDIHTAIHLEPRDGATDDGDLIFLMWVYV